MKDFSSTKIFLVEFGTERLKMLKKKTIVGLKIL